MRRIAVEEAFITADILAGWRKVLAGSDVEPGFAKLGGSLLRPSRGTDIFLGKLLDIGAGRIAHMDKVGMDVEVLSLTSPGVQIFDADRATRLAGEANDALAEAIMANPTRLAGLAAVAPQDPQAAAREIERGKKLGLSGVIINSHTRSEYLDLAKYRPILEAAEALDMPIYLHPREPGPSMVTPYLDYGLYFATWGFSAETGLHAMRLIMSGAFDRHPGLRIVLGHMGEGIPYWLKRIDNRYALQVKIGATEKLPRRPSEYFLENFYITTAGVTDMAVLKLGLAELGEDRIMFAADYPYEDDAEAVQFMDGAEVTEEQRRKTYETNALRIFKLRV
jgi:2,3-dihydroxybenzoate decarboxylase